MPMLEFYPCMLPSWTVISSTAGHELFRTRIEIPVSFGSNGIFDRSGCNKMVTLANLIHVTPVEFAAKPLPTVSINDWHKDLNCNIKLVVVAYSFTRHRNISLETPLLWFLFWLFVSLLCVRAGHMRFEFSDLLEHREVTGCYRTFCCYRLLYCSTP